jgi:hypothetical protein
MMLQVLVQQVSVHDALVQQVSVHDALVQQVSVHDAPGSGPTG